MSEYYYKELSDMQVLDKIDRLSPGQYGHYLDALVETNDLRQSLFIASSYPIEE